MGDEVYTKPEQTANETESAIPVTKAISPDTVIPESSNPQRLAIHCKTNETNDFVWSEFGVGKSDWSAPSLFASALDWVTSLYGLHDCGLYSQQLPVIETT